MLCRNLRRRSSPNLMMCWSRVMNSRFFRSSFVHVNVK
jgi:hypothetical protein